MHYTLPKPRQTAQLSPAEPGAQAFSILLRYFLGYGHAVQTQRTLANNHTPCLAPSVVLSLTSTCNHTTLRSTNPKLPLKRDAYHQGSINFRNLQGPNLQTQKSLQLVLLPPL